MDHLRRHLYLLPIISGTAWLLTLSPLLIAWLADGRPIYPDQSNPYIAFISDIGAFRLQPLFITGSTVTGVSYFLTFVAIYWTRYDERFHAKGNKGGWRKRGVELLGVIGAGVAGVCLVCLSVLDTYEHHGVHAKLLFCTFVGLAVSAISVIGLKLVNPITKGEEFVGSRPYCAACTAIVGIEVVLSVIFFGFLVTDHMHTAGILEWVITFLGVGYLWSLVAFVLPPEEKIDGERAPLLQAAAVSRG